MENINVLVTSAGSAPGVSVIKALRKQNELKLRIVAVDMDELSSGFHLTDKCYTVPGCQSEDFITKVIEICQKEKIDMVIPIIDEELPVFAKSMKLFLSKGLKLLVNEAEVIERGSDKYKTYLFCRENGIRTPPTFLPVEINDASSLEFPLMAKPRRGRGSVSILKIENEEQFRDTVLPNNDFIVQKFIPGIEFTVDVVASPQNEILQVIPRERIMVKAGVVYKGRTKKDADLMDLAKETAHKFGINGPCNIQFMKSNGGKFYLIEVNPKFSGGLPLTVNAGVNIPLVLIKMHMGMDVRAGELEFKNNFYMLRYWEEVYIAK